MDVDPVLCGPPIITILCFRFGASVDFDDNDDDDDDDVIVVVAPTL